MLQAHIQFLPFGLLQVQNTLWVKGVSTLAAVISELTRLLCGHHLHIYSNGHIAPGAERLSANPPPSSFMAVVCIIHDRHRSAVIDRESCCHDNLSMNIRGGNTMMKLEREKKVHY